MTGRTFRLLIADQDDANRTDLSRRLQELDVASAGVANGVKTIEQLRSGQFDLLLLRSPLNDSAETVALVRQIKAEPTLAVVPIIAMTGPGDNVLLAELMAAGAEDYLFTPISPVQLRQMITAYLEVGRQRREALDRHEREMLLKIERDVQIARDIQRSFLPSTLPSFDNWELAAFFQPAREVAGDFYDAFSMSQGRRLGFVIADVCDKGVGAALFMALIRSMIRAFAQQNFSLNLMDTVSSAGGGRRRALPSIGTNSLLNAVTLTNEYITTNHMELNYFATMFFAVIDPDTGSMVYVNGGHNPPMILDVEGKIKSFLKPTGPAVGMMPGSTFRIGQADLEPGEMLFAFTDGCTDARTPAGKLFGEKALEALVTGEPAPSAQALLDRVQTTLTNHIATADQFDDITMLCAKWKAS